MPLQPKELAPPRCSLSTETELDSALAHRSSARTCRTCGLSTRSCVLSAVPPSINTLITSMTFATPAVDSVWPTLPLMAQTEHVSFWRPCLDTIAEIELTSIGSPSAVPVPWASITLPASTAASVSAA